MLQMAGRCVRLLGEMAGYKDGTGKNDGDVVLF